MAIATIGAAVQERTADLALRTVQYAEQAGVPTMWLTTGAGPDAMVVFAAAAATTQRIRLGTAIVPTFPRHPVVVAQQAADIAALAPGRFVLGVGPSHAPGIEGRYGIPYERPLEHVREFVAVVKALLTGGQTDFEGRRFRVHGRLAEPAEVPVIISALRERSFDLAGAIADGAVTWLCPAPYMRSVALPALERAAAAQGGPRARLIGHAFVCLSNDRRAVTQAVNEQMATYPRSVNYQEMFAAAGYPEARQGEWSDAMLDAVVLHGTEAVAREKVLQFMAVSSADELILSVLPAGPDRTAAIDHTLDWIGDL